MNRLEQMLRVLDEHTIAREVAIPHDEARMAYALRSNTVRDFDEFTSIIADYYNYHFTRCVSQGGTLSRANAAGRAKEILERAYRRRNGTVMTAFRDAADGLEGGLRHVIDLIAESVKTDATEAYITDVFQRYVDPSSWQEKVEIIRQFIAYCGPNLTSAIDRNHPERYAHDYSELIRSYTTALQQTGSIFRRM